MKAFTKTIPISVDHIQMAVAEYVQRFFKDAKVIGTRLTFNTQDPMMWSAELVLEPLEAKKEVKVEPVEKEAPAKKKKVEPK